MEGSQNRRASPSTTRNLPRPHRYDNITAPSDLDARNRSRTNWVSSASPLQARNRLSAIRYSQDSLDRQDTHNLNSKTFTHHKYFREICECHGCPGCPYPQTSDNLRHKKTLKQITLKFSRNDERKPLSQRKNLPNCKRFQRPGLHRLDLPDAVHSNGNTVQR